MMKFHLDSQGILRSATRLALCLQAPAVEVEHFLLCDPENDAGPVAIRDIPFSTKVLAILEAAADLAFREQSAILRTRHLQIALQSDTGLSPEWGLPRQPMTMWDLVKRSPSRRLEYKGVNLEHLHRALHGLTVRECRPGPDFIDSQAGRRFADIAGGIATQKDAPALLLLLSYLLCEGAATQPLIESGLNEKLLLALLTEPPEELREPSALSFDFSQLVMDQARLSDDAQQTLEIAWILREGSDLRGTDLLRGLVATSNPMEKRNVQTLLKGISGDDFSSLLTASRAAEPKARVVLSPEIHRIMGCALREAGPVALINNLHLLTGLAECGNEMLNRRGVNADKIRGYLG